MHRYSPCLGGAAIAIAFNLLPAFVLPADAASATVLHYFNGTPDGFAPNAGLIRVAGRLYGTTREGGAYGSGAVFSIAPDGSEKVLHSFSGANDGMWPAADLVNVDGTLYGTTTAGGGSANCSYGCGTVFSVSRRGGENVLHSFASGADGNEPSSALINVGGILYGTTYGGGASNSGTVFSIAPDGTETVLYAFKAGPDGQYPSGGLINVNGTLYGTTQYGGNFNVGTVFSITANGVETVVYSFCSQLDCSDGVIPRAGLTNVNGTLYSTTSQRGAYDQGTAFSLTPDGTETTLHSFGKGSDGETPFASLISRGNLLYGTTFYGGAYGYGTVFSLRRDGGEKVLYSFMLNDDGGYPAAEVTNLHGTLYGTTVSGGVHNYDAGTVFKINLR